MVPGPNVLVIVSTSISQGTSSGLYTVCGTASAMAIQLVLAAIGTSWLVNNLVSGLLWLKWFGVAYLIYLGVSNLRGVLKNHSEAELSNRSSLQRGFWVSLSNPKTLIFFTAFLPQFVQDSQIYLLRIWLLSLLFWLLATLIDSAYALLAGKISGLLRDDDHRPTIKGISGCFYLAAGTVLAINNLENPVSFGRDNTTN